MPPLILPRDQDRELERVGQVERRQLFRDRLGDDEIAVLERSSEDGAGTALRGRRASSPGPDGVASLDGRPEEPSDRSGSAPKASARLQAMYSRPTTVARLQPTCKRLQSSGAGAWRPFLLRLRNVPLSRGR